MSETPLSPCVWCGSPVYRYVNRLRGAVGCSGKECPLGSAIFRPDQWEALQADLGMAKDIKALKVGQAILVTERAGRVRVFDVQETAEVKA